jgi:ATP phosphoribosyltransferase
VGSGQLDVGITGRDLLLDSGAKAEEVMALGFGESTFRFATRPGTAATEQEFAGLRVATSYPGLVAAHLQALGVPAEVIRLDGAVETSVRLGVADVIADVVETGSTLRQAGLELVGEPILRSEAVLVQRAGATASAAVEQLERRLGGVIVAGAYVIFDYDVRAELLDAACTLTPGIESPTVSPLRDTEWVAVRALVPRIDTNPVMDQLYDMGARGILVTDIHACRL